MARLGFGGGKQGEEASWASAFIFCKESRLSAGGNGQGFTTFAPDTDHSGNNVRLYWSRETAGRKQGQVTRPAGRRGETGQHLVKGMVVMLMF